MADVVKWLTSTCGVPREVVPLLWADAPAIKRFHYEVTHEAFVREILRDWHGNDDSGDDWERSKSELMAKYDIVNEDLDSVENLWLCGKCLFCGECFDNSASPAILQRSSELQRRERVTNAKRLFLQHVRAKHLTSIENGRTASLMKRGEEIMDTKKQEAESAALRDGIGFFRKLENKGPIAGNSNICADATGRSRNVRKKRPPRFWCELCSENFTTSTFAMSRHARAHMSDDFIVVSKIRSGASRGQSRPEQHVYNEQLGRYFSGSDASTCSIVLPESMPFEDNELRCRN
eukprot:gene288-381_t